MRELLTIEKRADSSRELKLDLLFSYDGAPGHVGGHSTHASLTDCARLIKGIERWIGLYEVTAATLHKEEPAAIDFATVAAKNRTLEASSDVIRLQYGSPFLVEVALTSGSIPALGLLLYGAKRLHSYDLELKNHRERLKIEYLEAIRYREQLEAEPPPIVDTALGVRKSPSAYGRWKLEGGGLIEDGDEA